MKPKQAAHLTEALARGTPNRSRWRSPFLEALVQVSPSVAAILVENPKTLRNVAEAILKAGAKDARAIFEELLRPASP